jgi:tetratricopeptide (TPR) repeat protein
MQSIVCAHCGHASPRSAAYQVGDALFCETCGLAEWERRNTPTPIEPPPARLIDPTVCARCDADQGAEVLPLLGGAPACTACFDRARHFPFPLWVRASFLVLLALAVASFLVNLRFLRGYVEVNRAVRQLAAGNLERANALATAAAGYVPESGQLQAVSSLYRGLILLREEKWAEALPLVEIARRDLEDASLDPLLLRIQGVLAFEVKDYDRFLDRMVALQKLLPDEAMNEGGVASALACKFAVSGDDTFAQQALEHLKAARKLKDSATDEYRDLEERVLHRLSSREILTRKEYLQRMGR